MSHLVNSRFGSQMAARLLYARYSQSDSDIVMGFLLFSGVQRLLDARGQQGSWMPSIFFQISPLKVFSIRLAKFLTTFFLLVTFWHQFSNFTKIHSLDAPPVLHAPITTFFSLFLVMTFTYFLRFGDCSSPGRFVPDCSSWTVCPTDCSSHGLFIPLSYKVLGIKNLANNCFINPTSI